MDTLEEKLLKKMTYCHFKFEMLDSIENSAAALCKYTQLYHGSALSRKIADENIPKILANLELNILLLKKAYYPNTQEFKEQIVQEISKKYDIVDNY